MHHGVGAVIDQHPPDGLDIVNRGAHERNAGGQGFGVAGRQIVEHGDRMAGIDQGADRVTADVTCAPGDDYARHGYRPIEK